MKSRYKRIGDYIRLVDERNRDLNVTTLLGLSIDKIFIASVANIIGSDMANYKIIRKGQFSCSLMQVRRDKKIPVALLRDFDEAIISQAYPVFEIIDQEQLLPEYLMMWMSRSEFDRHACFLAVGGVRGSLEWEDFCNMELPVPSPGKQREIVREYNVITDRIKLNEQLNQKLEETAHAIYKRWFVDFEFPISAEYAASIDKPELEGKPYKSSGGEMIFCEELGCEIPKGWELKAYEHAIDFKTGKLNSNAACENGAYPFFTCSSETFKTNTFSFDCEAVLLAGNNASAVYPLKFYEGKFDVYQRTYVATTKHPRLCNQQVYFSIKNELEGFKGSSSGTATKFLTMQLLNSLKILIAGKDEAVSFLNIIKTYFYHKLMTEKELAYLREAKDIILSKMSVTKLKEKLAA